MENVFLSVIKYIFLKKHTLRNFLGSSNDIIRSKVDLLTCKLFKIKLPGIITYMCHCFGN